MHSLLPVCLFTDGARRITRDEICFSFFLDFRGRLLCSPCHRPTKSLSGFCASLRSVLMWSRCTSLLFRSLRYLVVIPTDSVSITNGLVRRSGVRLRYKDYIKIVTRERCNTERCDMRN